MTDSIISSFVAEQKELLALELQADNDNDDDDNKEERASHVLGNLEAVDVSVGLYGRTVVQLTLWSEKATLTNLLPAHRLTVGDEVQIRSKQTKPPFPAGVVSEVSDTHVAVALFSKKQQSQKKSNAADDDDNDDGLGIPPLTLVPVSSAEVHKKLLQALETLQKQGVDHPIAGRVIQAMFIPESFPPPPPPSFANLQPFNAGLDSSQLDAIAFGLMSSDRPFALIHGPPGTGKTTTVTELIQQAVFVHKWKVLVTAPSNVAVDNVLERLVASTTTTSSKKAGHRKSSLSKIRAVRLGHPARLKSSILPYSLEALVQSADGTDIVADVRRELGSYLKIASNPRAKGSDKRIAYRELKTLRKEIRMREEKVVQELIDSAQVVLATTVGAANRILDRVDQGFDLVVIDEAAQALEASCWIPILRGKRVVLAGDHCQLPPTIKSKHSRAQKGLGRTMFERLMQLYGDDKPGSSSGHNKPIVSRMLNVQYRMHQDIANWASSAMYHGKLETHQSVQKRTLSQLEGIMQDDGNNDDSLSTTPLLLIDTAGCDMHELVNAAGSRYNPGEATLVVRHVQTLIGMGLKPHQMCVITPYNGQCEYLRNVLLPDYPTLEIRSVDGFQGGEREAVILSLVRSSGRGGKDGIGFLKDDRRQNVAVTRAKRHLAVICDTETVSQSKFIASLIAWMEEHGEQRSAMEYQAISNHTSPDEDDLQAAEAELLKLVEASVPQTTSKSSMAKKTGTQKETPKMGPEARQGLMDEIAAFAKKAKPGEEMTLSTTLTSFDRRLVHEFAEQIGLGHRSEGTEGQDRRIILKKEQKSLDPLVLATETATAEAASATEVAATEKDEEPTSTSSSGILFSALAIDDSDDSDSESDDIAVPSDETRADAPVSEGVVNNSLLASLAKERAERQQVRGSAHATTTPAKKNGKKQKKPKGPQKLGGTKVPESKQEDNLDDLDDMAFLDAQIEKAQTAHGRNVAGSGKGYRTVVNGILNARPEPRPAQTNTRAAATLQSKLREAQNGRKAKTITKKKK